MKEKIIMNKKKTLKNNKKKPRFIHNLLLMIYWLINVLIRFKNDNNVWIFFSKNGIFVERRDNKIPLFFFLTMWTNES